MADTSLFSKEALDNLRSPEKLDTMLGITTPIGWMVMVALALMVFSIILWSVFGSMSEKAEGAGILLDSDGVVSVAHTSSGSVVKLYVQKGSQVKKGDVLAVLSQPEVKTDIKAASKNVYLGQNFRDSMQNAANYDAKMNAARDSETVISSYDGIVDQVDVEIGSVVQSGSRICTIRRTQNRDDIAGTLYVPADEGKKIEPGMTVQISPEVSNGGSKNGSLIGVVRSISQYPVSQENILQKIGNNQQLPSWFAKHANTEALAEVSFDLVKDDTSATGYLWTSIIGQHRLPTPGSVCTGFVIVDSQPPLEKVFYRFSDWLRSR